MSVKLCKVLATQDLVCLTTQMLDDTRAIVRLTSSATLIDELGSVPDRAFLVGHYLAGRRPKPNWFVEVTQPGLDLVSAAFEEVASA